MAINQCVICEDWFVEHKDNPGNLCPICREKIEIENLKKIQEKYGIPTGGMI